MAKKLKVGTQTSHEGNLAFVLNEDDGKYDLVVFHNSDNQVQFVKGVKLKTTEQVEETTDSGAGK